MEKRRGRKLIIIFVLMICTVSLTIAFASLSASFDITEGVVTVNPNSNLLESNMMYTGTPSVNLLNKASLISAGVLEKNVWSGIEFKFEGSSASASISANILNNSNYDAYLTEILTTNQGASVNDKVVCQALTGTSSSLVDKICSKIQVNVSISGKKATATANTAASLFIDDEIKVASSNTVPVSIEVKIDASDEDMPDGDFVIYIPTVEINFSTVSPVK